MGVVGGGAAGMGIVIIGAVAMIGAGASAVAAGKPGSSDA